MMIKFRFNENRPLLLVALFVLAAQVATGQAPPAPTFTKSFEPGTIGPGSVSMLRFTISNAEASAVTGLSFADPLPAGLTIATPANASSTCQGSLSAPAGGSTIMLSDGRVGAESSCTIVVGVTSSTPGTHHNVTGDLTFDTGNGGTASADLTVSTDRPGFLKSFLPTTVAFGSRSILTLTIDNSANSSAASQLRFTDSLPLGMTIASPANASTTCSGGVISAPAGGSLISFAPAVGQDASVAAGATCTVNVDVIGGAAGMMVNTTGDLTSVNPQQFQTRSSGKATAALTAMAGRITLTKSFTDDPVPPGHDVNLSFTILNRDRSSTAMNIAFTDDLEAVLAGLAPSAPLPSTPCGAGSSLSFDTGVLTLIGGSLEPSTSCTFDVQLLVPIGTASGAYPNTTSEITAEFGGLPVTRAPATELLFVSPVPLLTKTFLDDPVGAGGSVVLSFTLVNSSLVSSAEDVAFEDLFDVILPTASDVPADGFCGPGSTAAFTPLSPVSNGTPARLSVNVPFMAAGDSCTFDITLDVSSDASSGIYPNTTSPVTATIDGASVMGNPAADGLEVVGGPVLTKEFIDDPVLSGETATLEFTLTLAGEATGDATSIAFSDDLDAALTGLVATGLPQNDVCGIGSQISGTSTLLFSGGTLSPGESCSFSVAVQVPDATPAGQYFNTTSVVAAMVGNIETEAPPATDDLKVGGVTLEKEFIDDPVLPGGLVTLRFTVSNADPNEAATEIAFRDDLNAVVHDLNAAGLPLNDVCGAGSALVGASANRLLVFQGGALGPGESCTFDVTLNVPVGALAGTYPNTTSLFSASVGGSTVFFENAHDELIVDNDFLALSKEFTDDPTAPGATANLRFTLTNLDQSQPATDLSFTDDLSTVIPGLVAVGLPAAACGGTVSGTNVISFTGGALAAGSSCTFDVTLMVPAATTPGSFGRNVTSEVLGMIGGFVVRGDPAVDEIEVNSLGFSKAFMGTAEAGGTVTLKFTIQNVSATSEVTGLEFGDNLDDMIPGLVATGLPASDVCGAGSLLSGTSTLLMTNGNLLPGGSCTFSVTLAVPPSVLPGDYLNVTSTLRRLSQPVAAEATATLTVVGTQDDDGDGVPNALDACPGTVIPEGVPTRELKPNHYALVDGDTTFDTAAPKGGGNGPGDVFSVDDTAGCSCEQIIEKLHLGEGETKFGCSVGTMRTWVDGAKP